MGYLDAKYDYLKDDVGTPEARMASATPAVGAGGPAAGGGVNYPFLAGSFLLEFLKRKEEAFEAKRMAESDNQVIYGGKQAAALNSLNQSWKDALLRK